MIPAIVGAYWHSGDFHVYMTHVMFYMTSGVFIGWFYERPLVTAFWAFSCYVTAVIAGTSNNTLEQYGKYVLELLLKIGYGSG